MTYAPRPDTAIVEACVRKHRPGADDVSAAPITTGLYNASYFISCAAGELVLRIAPPDKLAATFYEHRMMHQEPSLHELLLARTTVPVAPIVAFDTNRDILDRDFLLMERLPGTALSEARGVNSASVLQQVGESLARVHALHADTFGYRGEHRVMEPRESWADAFTVMWHSLVGDVARCGMYDAGEEKRIGGLVDEYRALFTHCPRASLLHMDIWSQNILVDVEGRLTGIVDWDRALWGDPEIEFAVLDYCGMAEPSFWRGYGRPRPRGPEARLRNAFYLLYEIQKYLPINVIRKNNLAAAHGYKRQVTGMVERLTRW
jgi:aminoglycoside phosphotransferase (APT) family kinase protein